MILSASRELTEADYKAFIRLKNNDDFQLFRAIVNEFQLTRAMNVLKGMEGSLDYLRGGYDMYVKLFRPVDNAEQMLEALQPHEEKNTKANTTIEQTNTTIEQTQ